MAVMQIEWQCASGHRKHALSYFRQQKFVQLSYYLKNNFWIIIQAVGALCIALLVDRGHLAYEHLVTKYWPEFGTNGKEVELNR